jgi:hypothetical protein
MPTLAEQIAASVERALVSDPIHGDVVFSARLVVSTWTENLVLALSAIPPDHPHTSPLRLALLHLIPAMLAEDVYDVRRQVKDARVALSEAGI